MSGTVSTFGLATEHQPVTKVLAVADLLQGSQGLYTVAVGILAFFFLIAGGGAGVAAMLRGKVGAAALSILGGVLCAVLIGSAYAIYLSTKRTVDTHTQITSGQFG